MDDIQSLAAFLKEYKKSVDIFSDPILSKEEYYSFIESWLIMDFLLRRNGISGTIDILSGILKEKKAQYKK